MAEHFLSFDKQTSIERNEFQRMPARNDTDILLSDITYEDPRFWTQRDEMSTSTHATSRTEDNYTAVLQDRCPELDQESSENKETTLVIHSAPDSIRKIFHFLGGIALAIFASLVLSVASLLVKLAESIPSLETVFIRLTLQLVFSLPALIFLKDQIIHPWKKTRLLILRGVTGVAAMSLMIYSVKHMPLADARVIFYSFPVPTALLGRIFLKESVSKFDVIATLLSLGGVFLIGRPTFLFGSLGKTSSSGNVWLTTILAVLSAIFTAFSIIVVRQMSQEVGARVVVFYFALVGSVISLLASLIFGDFNYPDCGTYDVIYTIVAGVLGYSGELLFTKACELEKAYVVSMVRTIGITFSFILQLIFLNVVPNGLSIGGAILILLCNGVIFLKKVFYQKKEQSVPASPSH